MNATITQLSGKQTQIDPRASVAPTAVLGIGCRIGAFAVIGDHVVLGDNTQIDPHGVVLGPTRMGAANRIHSFACIGGPPQDKRHNGEPTELIVGDHNVFREHVTINRGTVHGGGKTRVQNGNLFMAYSHIAHDCRVGSHTVLANHATVAGHTQIEDYVVFGGLSAVGTFLRIGESSMLAAGTMAERDVPPFCIVSGERARLRTVNRVGLNRRNFNDAAKQEIKEIFKLLKGTGRPLNEIITEMTPHIQSPHARHMLTFLSTVQKGLIR